MTWKKMIMQCLVVSSTATWTTHGDIAPSELNHTHVANARDGIIAALYRHQDPDRHWDPVTMPYGESTNQHLGGYTALVCLALITAGESYQDSRLQQPMHDLEQAQLKGTYAVATRALIWAALPDQFKPNLARDAKWLLDSYNSDAAGWDYKARPTGTIATPSPSIRHFGTLALWEAAKRGYRIPPAVLNGIEQVTLRNQDQDGAWHYKNEVGPSGSMTAAGLVTLAITDELLHANEAVNLKQNKDAIRHRSAQGGLAWLNDHFTSLRTPGDTSRGSRFPMYWLYAVERVGLAQGLVRLGHYDWFREGVTTIRRRLFEEQADGSLQLKSDYEPGGRASALRELSFALLFLSRGSSPIAINKLEINGWRWNNRPRDVANLCRSMSSEHETPLHWQSVTLEDQQLFNAPVLYLASDQALPFLAPHAKDIREFGRNAKDYLKRRRSGTLVDGERAPRPPTIAEIKPLRKFIESGGLLLAINEGRSTAFAKSIHDLGTLLNPGIEWTKPLQDHWLFNEPHPVRGKRPAIEVFGTDVREWIVLLPRGDAAEDLQVPGRAAEPVMTTLSNLYARASGMLRTQPRLDAARPLPTGNRTASAPCRIRQVIHDGMWRPEPMAMAHLSDAMEQSGLATDVRAIRLNTSTPLEEIDCLLVSGTGDTSLDPEIWSTIERYIAESRGVVLFEHTGGGDGGIFAARAEQDAMERFKQPVRSADRTAVITGEGIEGNVDCTHATWQPYSITEIFAGAATNPRLRFMNIDGTPRLFFSREDLTHALLGSPHWGVHGYTRTYASNLLCNLARYGHSKNNTP